jgi:hypothetical protein
MGDPADALRQFLATVPDGSVELHATFHDSAFHRLQCDAYANGKPGRMPHLKDQGNWDSFVAASRETLLPPSGYGTEGFPNRFAAFSAWETYNRSTNGLDPDAGIPDRRHSGNPEAWPSSCADIPLSLRPSLTSYLDAGRCFMNLCDDLQQLATEASLATAAAGWQSLLKSLDNTVHRDVAIWFTRPTLLALVRLCAAEIAPAMENGATPGTAHYFHAKLDVV